MTKDNALTELEERLAEAQAQIESLQATAADATARAATVQSELEAAREAQSESVTRAEQAEAAAADAEALRSRLAEAAAQYRTARLAASPDVPPELVPERATIEEIDAEMEAAQRVVSQLRERLQKEALAQRGATRVPAGSPGRRTPDLASLPASEKIRVGLQQLSEREGR